MFYLSTHSTPLRLYGVGHMVNDHSNSERGNPVPSRGLLFSMSSKDSRPTCHGLCYTSRGALAETRIASTNTVCVQWTVQGWGPRGPIPPKFSDLYKKPPNVPLDDTGNL